jgi:hypothetical protein
MALSFYGLVAATKAMVAISSARGQELLLPLISRNLVGYFFYG